MFFSMCSSAEVGWFPLESPPDNHSNWLPEDRCGARAGQDVVCLWEYSILFLIVTACLANRGDLSGSCHIFFRGQSVFRWRLYTSRHAFTSATGPCPAAR